MEAAIVANKTTRLMHIITRLCPRTVTSICTIQDLVLKVLVAKQQNSKILSHVSHTVHTLACKSVCAPAASSSFTTSTLPLWLAIVRAVS